MGDTLGPPRTVFSTCCRGSRLPLSGQDRGEKSAEEGEEGGVTPDQVCTARPWPWSSGRHRGWPFTSGLQSLASLTLTGRLYGLQSRGPIQLRGADES